jgi:hypothetical protein
MIPGTVVKEGIFFYGSKAQCDVCIVRSFARYGTGDLNDPPEISNDIDSPTYYLYWGSTTKRGQFNAGGGAYSSLAEAIVAAETAPGIGPSVRWASET